MTKTAAEVFRDYEVDGDPSSGAHKPIKSDIRDLLGALESGGVIPTIQQVTSSSATVDDDTTHLIINRSAPSATALNLPDASTREGKKLSIVDYSTSVTAHAITLTPAGSQKIMRQSSWGLSSNTDSLASVTLVPIEDPDDASKSVWIIAP